jgi:DNA-binding response OmpR family regulator
MEARIVIADDEPHILRLLDMALTRGGYPVVTARDGEEALARVRDHAPVIVILDGEMPRRSGYEVARAVRDDPAISVQPYIIMLTAGGQPADAARAAAAGVDEFLTKPFSPRRLVSRVREVLDDPARRDGQAGGAAPS